VLAAAGVCCGHLCRALPLDVGCRLLSDVYILSPMSMSAVIAEMPANAAVFGVVAVICYR
jgi:hypothetical protein